MKKEASSKLENLGMIEDIVSNDDLTETTSISSDLTVKEASNTVENKANVKVSTVNTITKENKKIEKNPIEAKITNTDAKTDTKTNLTTNNIENNLIEEKIVTESIENEKLEFVSPVNGEIIKDFAMDNLIYSNTLEEWTTHPGIDIKAEKTSIVTASENGIVESIKNDPRYGLTITISHNNGFKTIYSNLLTTEFVTENEEVEKGETIGTIGESASFEIADTSHLHFEMYKDGELVNPTIYFR